MATVFKFPDVAARRVARQEAARKPCNSKNGTPEEMAAKIARQREKRLTWYWDFGRRLRVTRLALGITEVEAAAAWRITLHTYQKWEAGLPGRLKHSGLLSFAKKYDVSFNWLLDGSGEMRASAEETRKAEFAAAYNALDPNQQAMVMAKIDKTVQSGPPARPALVLVSDNKWPA